MARKQKNLSVRDTFYIITNGRQTEKNYFELVRCKKSIYNVKVEFHNSDPVGLVQYASTLVPNSNQVWCVFDIDNTYNEGTLIPALKLAKSSGVQIAFSNISFEVWLLSHYGKVDKYMNNDKVINEMNVLLSKLGISQPYDKSDKELLKKHFIPKLDDAVLNSKIVYQNRVKEHNALYHVNSLHCIWEWNSCTNIYQLIEALQFI